MKKITGLILTMAVVICFQCIGSNISDVYAETEDPKIRIAYNISSEKEDARFSVFRKNLDILEKMADVEFINIGIQDFGTSNESSVYYVEYAIEQNVDGLMLCPSSDQVLPTISRMCADADVYWGIYFRSISDEEIRETCEASPYYVGNICEDEETMGYQITKAASDMGYQNLGIISTGMWDTTGQRREKGVHRAIEETAGMRILENIRDVSSGEDAYEATRSLLTAYPTMDCIILAAATDVETQNNIVRAIKDTGKETGLFTIDFMNGCMEAFDAGILKAVTGLPKLAIDPYYLALKILNVLKGVPLEENSSTQTVPSIMITDKKEAEQIQSVIEADDLHFFTEDFIKNNLFKWNAPELNGEQFQKIINENIRLTYSKNGN